MSASSSFTSNAYRAPYAVVQRPVGLKGPWQVAVIAVALTLLVGLLVFTRSSGAVAEPLLTPATSELNQAQALLNQAIAANPALADVSVRIAKPTVDAEASIRLPSLVITIDPDHTVSLERLMAHELAHAQDYLESGRIDHDHTGEQFARL